MAKAGCSAETEGEGVQGEPEVCRIDHGGIPVQFDDVLGDGDSRGGEGSRKLTVVASCNELAAGAPSDQATSSRRSECGLEVSEVGRPSLVDPTQLCRKDGHRKGVEAQDRILLCRSGWQRR